MLAVGCAAILFLHTVPGGGNDIALELACVPLGRAGWVAAGTWVGGARLAFAVAASNGAGPAIAHHITGLATPAQ